MCDKCGKKFHAPSLMKDHHCSGVKGDPGQGRIYHCQECNIEFTTGSSYFRHYSVAHNKLPPEHEGKEMLICDECGKTFASKLGLKAHMMKQHQNIGEVTLQDISFNFLSLDGF